MAKNKKPGGPSGRQPGYIKRLNQSNLTENSAELQCIRLLKHLQTEGSCTTTEARQLLDIIAPAARVFDLRNDSIDIATIWTTVNTAYGKSRRIARYVLLSGRRRIGQYSLLLPRQTEQGAGQ